MTLQHQLITPASTNNHLKTPIYQNGSVNCTVICYGQLVVRIFLHPLLSPALVTFVSSDVLQMLQQVSLAVYFIHPGNPYMVLRANIFYNSSIFLPRLE